MVLHFVIVHATAAAVACRESRSYDLAYIYTGVRTLERIRYQYLNIRWTVVVAIAIQCILSRIIIIIII